MKREPFWRRYLRFWGPDVHRDIDEELDFHLEMRAREFEVAGLSPEAACEAARRRFGNAEAVRSECHAMGEKRINRWRRSQWWESLAYDVRYAVRGLKRQPGFTAVVVLTLGLGIGANAVMFGVIDRLLLEPPAGVRDAGAVKRVYLNQYQIFPASGPTTQASATYPDYAVLRDHGDAFASVAAYFPTRVTYGRGRDAQQIQWGMATASFFPLLGLRPALGRFFTAEEDTVPFGARVVVLSYDFWQREFGRDTSVLGRLVDLGKDRYTVIGVAPKGFTGIDFEAINVWVPLTAARSSTESDPDWYQVRDVTWIHILARLRAGVSLEHATAQATTLFRRSLAEDARRRPAVVHFSDSTASITLGSLVAARGPLHTNEAQSARIALWLGGVAAIVLLIACANVANLLLARSARRRREIAVRLALGVGRGRLARQTLTETLMLAALGATAGLVLARWGGIAFRAALLPGVTWTHSPVSRNVFVMTVAITMLTALLAWLAPVMQASRTDLVSSLKAGARAGTFRRTRTRSALLIAQAALSVVLLIGAGLFVRSLTRVVGQDMGFDARSVLMVTADLGAADYTAERTRAFFQFALDRVQHLPGVTHAALAVTAPFYSSIATSLHIPGRDSLPQVKDGGPYINKVTSDYFATMGTRIERGRGFNGADVKGAPRVTVVSATMARLMWPGERAIGKCIQIGGPTSPCTAVVGVAEDALRQSINPAPVMQYYVPLDQTQSGAMRLLFVRVSGDPAPHIPDVRQAVQSISPDLPFVSVQPLQSLIDPSIRPWRLGATMFTVFGALSLVIAAIGLYGVVTYDVSQRGHEFGVRMALGAQRTDILRLVLLDGVRLAAVGIALGALIALALSRFVAPLLFETSARDPFVFGTVVLVLLTVAVTASLLPGRRATRVDPAEALRTE